MSSSTLRAADFLNGIGVATHIPYTDGGYVNLARVQSDLAYLGVEQLRDGISNGENGSAPLASYIQLAKAGARFTFVVGSGSSTTASIQSTLSTIAQLAAAVPGSVKAIEGPNEINNQPLSFNGLNGLSGAVALQQYLYQAVKGTPALAGVAVDYFTGYSTINFGAGPNPGTASGLADYDNQHPYPQGGRAPGSFLAPSQALPNEPGSQGKFVYTETGYTSNIADVNGVDATVQGKYTLDLLMDAAKDGASGTYLYQLLDAYQTGSPQGNDGYGLFDTGNNPKLAATGIHNLTTILADPGASASSFTPTALDYSVSGLPATGNSLAIGKSDGTTDIAVWAEPDLWNAATKSEVAAPTETVTVNLGSARQVSVYDPLVGTSPVATYAGTSSVQVQVSDHPLILQVGAGPASGAGSGSGTATVPPAGGSTTPGTTGTGTAAAPTTGGTAPQSTGGGASPSTAGSTAVGSGTDSLVLAVSEDAYQGDARYTVSVDGKQVGGTLTATASHAAGAANTVTVSGNWGVGNHAVSVNFLNDAYDGTSSTDRNLYVNGVTYDGAAVADGARSLMSSGQQQIAVKDVTPVSADGQNASVGTGLDHLVLAIGQDAYQGDALYTIAVDGKQVGGTQTAHASQAAGQSDLVDVYGNWGAGNHTVAVDFLNDAYNGTASTDRNLYVNGITYDGAVNSTATKALMSAGTQSFGFHR